MKYEFICEMCHLKLGGLQIRLDSLQQKAAPFNSSLLISH
jgi:hypothetical protein